MNYVRSSEVDELGLWREKQLMAKDVRKDDEDRPQKKRSKKTETTVWIPKY